MNGAAQPPFFQAATPTLANTNCPHEASEEKFK
jgi:hypothetical protein